MKLDMTSIPPSSTAGRVWSAEQLAFLDLVGEPAGPSILLIAVAGSGKTTILVEATKRMSGRVALCAYNKKIADEIKTRITDQNVRVGTFHSFGFGSWKQANPRCKVNGKKLDEIIDDVGVPWKFQAFVSRMVSLAKQSGIGIPGLGNNWSELADHHNLWDALQYGGGPAVFDWCYRVMQESMDRSEDVIDFDDMLFEPLRVGLVKAEYDWVLIDEAQDTNVCRRLMARSMLRDEGRIVAVGDPCQPTGTLVSVVKSKADRWNNEVIESKPIEQLEIGDLVISYNKDDCSFIKGRRVEGITSRPYEGELIKVTTFGGGWSSRYTPNHHCLASFSPLRNKEVVYLMQRGRSFRIGRCKMDYGNRIGNGPAARMRAEGANSIWILHVCDSTKEAIAFESLICAEYSIPQLVFRSPTSNTTEQSSIDAMWTRIGDLSERGFKCLRAHNRYLEHPLFTSHQQTQRTLKRPIIVHASNLLTGCLMLPYSGKTHSKQTEWECIQVTREQYQGYVYSLTVEGEHLYCADGLMTHNCQAIYGFTGADNDSLELIRTTFGCVEMPLTTTYRCPKAVVAHAQQWVSHIHAAETAPEGEVLEIDDQAFRVLDTRILKAGTAVLCRNTKPLVSTALRLARQNIPCRVEGRELGQGLYKLAQRVCGKGSLRELESKLEDYREKECRRFREKKQQSKIDALNDQCDSLLAIYDSLESGAQIYDLKAKIDTIFGDSEAGAPPDRLILSTVHKAKGREWDMVYLYGRDQYMPSKWATQDWEKEQERNLIYVAVTRAKKTLVEVRTKPREET